MFIYKIQPHVQDWLQLKPIVPIENNQKYLFPTDVLNIVNSVCTFTYDKEISVREILNKNDYSNTKKFQAILLRLYPIRTTSLNFKVGKIVIIGAKNIYTAIYCAHIYSHIISKALNHHENKLTIRNFTVANMTATVKLPFSIDINKFVSTVPENVVVNPLFSGKFFKLHSKDKIRQIVSSKNLLITGACSNKEIVSVYKQSREIYESCKIIQVENSGNGGEEHVHKKQKLTKEEVDFLNCLNLDANDFTNNNDDDDN